MKITFFILISLLLIFFLSSFLCYISLVSSLSQWGWSWKSCIWERLEKPLHKAAQETHHCLRLCASGNVHWRAQKRESILSKRRENSHPHLLFFTSPSVKIHCHLPIMWVCEVCFLCICLRAASLLPFLPNPCVSSSLLQEFLMRWVLEASLLHPPLLYWILLCNSSFACAFSLSCNRLSLHSTCIHHSHPLDFAVKRDHSWFHPISLYHHNSITESTTATQQHPRD